jgi:aryl-alcohol dehydrogenase-like predicted oxidoreductase
MFIRSILEIGVKYISVHRERIASGILSGKYNLDTTFTEPSRLCWNKGGIRRAEYEYKINLLNKLTSAVNMNGAKVAYPFVFSNPNHLSVVMGVTSMMQLKENLDVESLYMDNDNYQYVAGIKC